MKKNHRKMKIHHEWAISQVKKYLTSINIQCTRIQSINNNILRLLFNDKK
jgi:hypothetical protein